MAQTLSPLLEQESPPIKAVLRRVLGIYVVTRLAIFAAAFYGEKVAPVGGLSGLLTGWDGQHYLSIAKYGYPQHPDVAHYSRIAFFPIYPVVVRIFSHLTHLSYLGVGVGVSLVAGAGFIIISTRLVARHFGTEAAERAGILLCLFPGSFILSLPYAEALALFLAASALLAAESSRTFRAGLFGALATATSPLMLALVPVMAWRAWKARTASAWRTVLITPLGFFGYMYYLSVHTGHLNAWFSEEREGFAHHVNFAAGLSWLGNWPGTGITEVAGIVVLMWAIVSFIRSRVPVEWWLYSMSIVVVVVFDAALILSPRILINAFPLILGIGVVSTRRSFIKIAISFAVLLPLVFLAYMTIGNITAQP
jgi:hypothetical protein